MAETEYSGFYFPEFSVTLGEKTFYPRQVRYKASTITEKLKMTERPRYDVVMEKSEQLIITGNIIREEAADFKSMIADNSGSTVSVTVDGQEYEGMYLKESEINMTENAFYFDYRIEFAKLNFEPD